MAEKGLFLQNRIAIIWDFDRTLSPHYMQRPVFKAYDVDEDQFWREVNALPEYYARSGIHVSPDTCYLGHLLSYVRAGRMPGLTNARLRELGAGVEFFPGVPDVLTRLKAIPHEKEFRQGDLHVEHYVVSTGLAEMVRGSKIARLLDGVWASEFIEEPAGPGFDMNGAPGVGAISQIATFLDNTTKTRAIFEINKGVNVESSITVNDSIPEEERRVPVKNMIYIADGPSDIPSFSVVRKHGGLAYAVYDPANEKQYAKVVDLHETDRVHMYGPADYRVGTPTDRWLDLQVRRIARRILADRKKATQSKVGKGPSHLDDKE